MSTHTHESAFNTLLAQSLGFKHPDWKSYINAEQSGVFLNAEQLRPDILISPPAAAPIVIETEFIPATEVESDAQSRLGKVVTKTGREIEQVAAVRIPTNLKSVPQSELQSKIQVMQIEWCFFQAVEGEKHERWPKSGWLTGELNDLARCIEAAASSEQLISNATEALERAVSTCAQQIQNEIETSKKFGVILHQESSEQTNRMGIAIIANAFNFHAAIAGNHGIPTLAELKGDNPVILKSDILDEWSRIIRRINYWPVFRIASDILKCIPLRISTEIIRILTRMTEQLVYVGVVSMHDISGRMLQKLITDRKLLATFYTLPSSAAFLSELAISQLSFNWNDQHDYPNLRVADFACGTGTLISAAYSSILSRYRRSGGNDRNVHSAMIENSLIATDIMPVATHLTASQLSSAHPTTTFGQCRVYTMPYGHTEDSGTKIGSLDLTVQAVQQSLFPTATIVPLQTTDLGLVVGPTDSGYTEYVGDEQNDPTNDIEILGRSLDIVIMNPPFTRPTNHKKSKVPIPSFAGFKTPHEEQKRMSNKLKSILKHLARNAKTDSGNPQKKVVKSNWDSGWSRKPAGHGNAGLASNFLDLAHAKVKLGGIIAFVLPFSFVNGDAWRSARQLIEDCYENIVVVSIAHHGQKTRAFSADTGMAEVLLICKRSSNTSSATKVTFVNLSKRPKTVLQAVELSRAVREISNKAFQTNRIELGNQYFGNYIKSELTNGGCAGLQSPELAESMISLSKGFMSMPRLPKTIELPITTLTQLGTRGLYHLDIGNENEFDSNRSIFRIVEYSSGAPYPALWKHNFKNETYLEVIPDCQGLPRQERQTRLRNVDKARDVKSLSLKSFEDSIDNSGKLEDGFVSQFLEEAAETYVNTATRLHFNLDFRLNSQSLAACMTPEPSLGGTAWPNFLIEGEDRDLVLSYEKIIALWANTTFGLMAFWWLSTRQQAGRARLTITVLPDLVVLNPLKLTDVQLKEVSSIFELFRRRKFLPANEAYRDQTRWDLDQAVFCELLQLPSSIMGALDNLRYQWCSEPSVHGGKSTKPDKV